MDKQQFEQLMSDPITCMVFHMDNWVSDPHFLGHNEKIVVNTMKKYLFAIRTKDEKLVKQCLDKFKEISDHYIK